MTRPTGRLPPSPQREANDSRAICRQRLPVHRPRYEHLCLRLCALGARPPEDRVLPARVERADLVFRARRRPRAAEPQGSVPDGKLPTRTFARLYIDHGTAPAGEDYAFVVIPGLQRIRHERVCHFHGRPGTSARNRVLAKDARHHVVKYQGGGKEIWGLVLFEDVSGLRQVA